jgi:NADH:ubiquinone oxidoreductase subunit F (NADH-binding)
MVERGGGLSFENVAPANVVLDTGQTAYFNVGYSDVNQGTTTCSVSTHVEITPPNDTAYSIVSVPQINACGGGTLDVSAVFASTDAAATSTTAPQQSG